jgi:hypothetical protein
MQIRTIWQSEYHEVAWWKAAAVIALSEFIVPVSPLALAASQEFGLLWVARLIGILHRVS